MHPQSLLLNLEYRFFSAANLPKIGHILGHKVSFTNILKLKQRSKLCLIIKKRAGYQKEQKPQKVSKHIGLKQPSDDGQLGQRKNQDCHFVNLELMKRFYAKIYWTQ